MNWDGCRWEDSIHQDRVNIDLLRVCDDVQFEFRQVPRFGLLLTRSMTWLVTAGIFEFAISCQHKGYRKTYRLLERLSGLHAVNE